MKCWRAAMMGLMLCLGCAGGASALEYDANVTFGDTGTGPSDPVKMLYGSGTNGGFTVDRRNGVELGLRAQLRFGANNQPQNIYNSNGDGTYSFAPGTPDLSKPHPDWATTTTPVWSVCFSVNTDYADRDGTPSAVLADYTYEVGIDFDPVGQNNWLRFDPISDNGLFATLGVPDSAFGLYTQQSPGPQFTTTADYANALGVYNILQNNTNGEFLNVDLTSFGQGDYSGFDPNATGAYTIYLAAFSGGTEVARTEITVLVGNPLVVPNVTGMTQAAAGAAITGAGLKVGAVTQVYSDTVPAGSIVSQNPAAGTVVSPGAPVALAVSAGPQPPFEPEPVTFGDIGTGPSDPVEMLYGTGNGNGGFTVARQNGVELGLRAQLRFDANNRAANVFNSNGDGTYSFAPGTPDLSKPHPDWATTTTPVWSVCFAVNTDYQDRDGTPSAVLDDYTYEVGIDFDPVGQNNWLRFDPISSNGLFNTLGVPDHAFGLYTQQSPGPQFNTPADYANALGTHNIVQNAANFEFVNMDLTAYGQGDYSGFDPNRTGAYTVYLAAFSGGVEVARTEITVLVGNPLFVPDVTGMAQAAAATAITGAGLKVGTVSIHYNDTVPAGSVVSQNPAAGSAVSAGASVALVVSAGPQPAFEPEPVTFGDIGTGPSDPVQMLYGAGTNGGFTVTRQNGVELGLRAQLRFDANNKPQNIYNSNGDGTYSFAPGTPDLSKPHPDWATTTTPVWSVCFSVNTDAADRDGTPSAVLDDYTYEVGMDFDPIGQNNWLRFDPISSNGLFNSVGVPDHAFGLYTQQSPGPQFTTPADYANALHTYNIVQNMANVEFVNVDLTEYGMGDYSGFDPNATGAYTVYLAAFSGGTEVARTEITVLVGNPLFVPDVTGMDQNDAQAALAAKGLVLGAVTQVYSATVPANLIVSQTPAAGTVTSAGAAVAVAVSMGPQPVAVPDVVGQPQADAAAVITGAGLAVGTVTQEYSLTVPAGSVISQSPVAGTQVLPGAAVNLVVSRGGVAVPDVTGQTQTAATTAITGAGLALGTVTQEYSLTVPAGSVISQSPVAGTQVLPGAAVSLVVSRGGVAVPDVTGQTQTAATTAITGAGLALGTVTQEYSLTVPAGSVISQSPTAGTQVLPGAAVSLVVSRGGVAVPDVTGQTQTAATTAITGAGLALGTVTQEYSLTVPAGSVISQSPTAGTQVLPGAAVSLVVSRGGVAVPDVTGQTQTAATTAITGAGLALGTVTQEYSLTVPAGSVISQSPTAGTQVLPGAAVSLVVSRGGVAVPDVTGQTQTAATTVLTGAGLALGTVTQEYSLTVPAGSVISQSPVAGTQVLPGATVNLVVSLGGVAVPDVTGQTQTAATTAITGAGLALGTVTQEYSLTVPAGSVISQSPTAGTQVLPGAAVSLVVSRGSQGGDRIPVPDVVGQTESAATAAIVNIGLAVGTITRVYNETVPAGSVISQSPEAGTPVEPGSAVDLVISLGRQGGDDVPVPNVVGQTESAAAVSIVQAGLVVGTVTRQHSKTVSTGTVLSQTPAAGVMVAPGSAVNLVVSLGPAPTDTVTVPDVTGAERGAAESALVAAGLVLGTVTETYSDTVPAGRVISQSPVAGLEVPNGTTVTLVISLGPKSTVPDVTGMSQEEAQDAVSAAGLVIVIAEEESDTVPAGTVIRQEPPAGSAVAPGSAVTVYVSSGPADAGCGGAAVGGLWALIIEVLLGVLFVFCLGYC